MGRFFVFILLFLLIFSCASPPPPQKNTIPLAPPPTVSEKERAIKYYRHLRKNNWESYKNRTISSRRGRYRLGRRLFSKERKEALKREYHQNMDYFCMAKNKKGRFISSDQCQLFVLEQSRECREIYGDDYSRSLLRCLKRRLR